VIDGTDVSVDAIGAGGRHAGAPLAAPGDRVGLSPALDRLSRLERYDGAIVILLLGVAWSVRIRGFGTEYLWRDDAWQALVIKVEGLQEFLLVAVSAPGYAATLLAWLGAVGFTPTRAQVPAFVAGVFGPAAFYLIARRLRVSRLAAAAGGVILAISAVHVTYSTRVKPFTLEALIAIGLVILTVRATERGLRQVQWMQLVAACILATIFSAMMVPTAAACLTGAAVHALTTQGRKVLPQASFWVALYGGFGLAWWWLVLRGVRTEALDVFWEEQFVGSAGGFVATGVRLVLRTGSLFRTLVLPPGLSLDGGGAQLLAVAIGVLFVSGTVLAARRSPYLAVLTSGPMLLTVALSLARVVPVGAGRTDIVLYPSLLLTLVLSFEWGLSWLGEHRERLAWSGFALAAGGLTLLAVLAARPYPPVPDVRPLVQQAEAAGRSSDLVVVLDGLLTYEIALVTTVEVAVVPSERSMTGFHVEFPTVASIIVEESYARPLEVEERRQDEYTASALATVMAAPDQPERVWVFGSMRPSLQHELERAGYRMQSEDVVRSTEELAGTRALSRWAQDAS
jgi:hypothetical protein